MIHPFSFTKWLSSRRRGYASLFKAKQKGLILGLRTNTNEPVVNTMNAITHVVTRTCS